MAAKMPKLRLLALHSFRTSGAIFKSQLQRSRFMERFESRVEIIFIDAPHSASGAIPKDVLPFFEGPYHEWFTVDVSEGSKPEYDIPKLETSTKYVAQVMAEQGPFDGLIGFSQGGSFASSILALQASGHPIFKGLPPLRFGVLFAAFPSRYEGHVEALEWMQGKCSTPVVHIYGDKDSIKRYCVKLADLFTNPIIMLHPRGHVIPVLEDHQVASLQAFLSTFSPGSSEGIMSSL